MKNRSKIKGLFCYFKNCLFLFLPLLQFMSFPLESVENQDNKTSEYTIVFVHMGSSLPSHIGTAIKQARLFNPNCRMILITNQDLLKKLPQELKNDRLEIIS